MIVRNHGNKTILRFDLDENIIFHVNIPWGFNHICKYDLINAVNLPLEALNNKKASHVTIIGGLFFVLIAVNIVT